jgi:filamentous hemagglutinin family protein
MQGLRRSLFLITLPLATLGCFASMDTATGQIIPDNSLGTENSVVNSNANTDLIDGGARRGANLFHSFQEFNVGQEGKAYFSNPAGIDNILSRVTGGRPSNIFGTLGVADGNANLFFINPNGILFGPDARLDMRGSFLASTANSLLFDSGLEFSAINPQVPPMLAINIPIGLRFRENPGSITNQSVADGVGLKVSPGKNLSLVGGDISLDRGRLTAAGGQIALGSLAEEGTVGLASDGGLSFADGVARGNVLLTNGAQVDVTAGGGGSINIYAQDLDILENSALCAGIGAAPICGKRASDFGSVGSKAGNVTLNTLNNLTINQGSQVENVVNIGAIGDAGDINISTKNLNLTNGARLNSSTFGEGNAGKITIDADTVSFDGVGTNGFFTGALSRVENKAIGNGGDITIKTKNLNLTNGARLYVGIVPGGGGKGNKAGTVTITNADNVEFKGVGSNMYSSGAFSVVNDTGIGNAGDINISTKNLALTNGARLNASSLGKGNAGTITINADNVKFDGVGYIWFDGVEKNKFFSGALSRMEGEDTGNAGSINITTKNLALTNGARLSIGLLKEAKGNAGTITINADTVKFDGVGKNGFLSGAFSYVDEKATSFGDGNINITTKNLDLNNGAQINSSTSGIGNAGKITIDADTVSFDGVGTADKVNFDGVGSNENSSGAFSIVQKTAKDNSKGGDIKITTKNLNLTNGARLNASTFGKGNAGNIRITAADTVSFDGVGNNTDKSFTGALSRVENTAIGNGGDITIETKNLNLTNGARLYVGIPGSGKGNAGKITITADDVKFEGVGSNGFPSGAFSFVDKEATSSAAAGSINITTKNLLALTNRAKINADNSGQGEEVDNIDITDGNKLTLYNNNESLPAESAIGKGGNIVLGVRDILLIRRGNISSIGSDIGPTFEGNIRIEVETLVLHGGSEIRTRAGAPQGGSNIKIDPLHGKLVVLVSHDSKIRAAGELKIEPNLKVQPSEIPQVKLVNPSEQIGQNPCQRGVDSKFIITGRGGLPPSPNDATSSDAVRVDLVELAFAGSRGAGEQRRRDTEEKTKSSVTKPIVPTQGWIFDKNGEVMLTAYDPTGTGSQRPLSPDSCPVP